MNARNRRLALCAILVLAAVVRLYHLTAPMADSLQAKQVYVANKAREIARTPWNPLRNSLDFLDARGDRTRLTEEVPIYAGALAVGYRLVGEREWVGHVLSLCGTLLALGAFFDLVRREWDDRSALRATALLSASPLLVFYGRAVLPDPWMLAGMIGSAACYRRYLDTRRLRWLIATAICGSCAALFKYFGLMIGVVLLEMTCRDAGSWRGVFSRRFLLLSAAIMAPVAAWMAIVFVRTPNPVHSGWVDGQVYPYLIIQAPDVLFSRVFWGALFGRFPVRDCGAVMAGLMALGIAGRAFRDRPRTPAMVAGWTVMGLLFFLLLAPKLRDHDYYGMMCLPAAALWATLGLQAISRRSNRLATLALVLAIAVQSPWVSPGFFRQDVGKLALSRALQAACPADSRVVAIGPGIEFPTVVHYSHREGWPIHSLMLPADWRSRMDRYRDLGASCVAVYFEPRATAEQRESYGRLIAAFPVLAHETGLATRSGKGGEYFILDLGTKAARAYDRSSGAGVLR